MALGACVAVCALALGVSALSGDASAVHTRTPLATVGKTVASKGVVPVEPLDGTKHGKAVRQFAPSVTTAAIRPPEAPLTDATRAANPQHVAQGDVSTRASSAAHSS